MIEATSDKKRYNKGWDNLKPIKKGEVRNPHGRPRKADCLLDCIKDELAKTSLNGVETNEQLTAAVLVKLGTQGNLKAIELEMAYLHAKPAQGIDLNKDGGLVIRVIRDSGTRDNSQDA